MDNPVVLINNLGIDLHLVPIIDKDSPVKSAEKIPLPTGRKLVFVTGTPGVSYSLQVDE